MKERPITLKDFEVRAILDGRKTQNRIKGSRGAYYSIPQMKILAEYEALWNGRDQFDDPLTRHVQIRLDIRRDFDNVPS